MFTVYSPSRFSYMCWTPTRFFNDLMPAKCASPVPTSRDDADALAAAVGDGVVMAVKSRKPAVVAPAQPTAVEPVADYW